MNKTFTSLRGAAFLLLVTSCGSSAPSEIDASIAHDAASGSGGTAAGGSPGGSGGILGTGGKAGGTGSGGAIGTGGVLGTGGLIVTGGITGTGGLALDGGGAGGIDGGSGQVCGGLAARACAKSQFCEYPLGACNSVADGTGICTTLTQVCPAIYQPVCGCDGKTYGNDCERQGAGVSKRAGGECNTTGKMCGGFAGIACSNGQFCDLTPGNCGRIADGAGTCAATGKDVGCITIYQPVCGCDGKTYGNDCERQVAGVSKVSDGACPVVDGGTRG